MPALLNQLVSDLTVADPALRPAGMHDVLHRLDQLEAYLGPGADPRLANEAPAPPAGVVGAEDVPVVAPVAPGPAAAAPVMVVEAAPVDDGASIPVLGTERRFRMMWLALALIPAVLISGAILLQPALEALLAPARPADETTVATTTPPPDPGSDGDATPPSEPPPASSGAAPSDGAPLTEPAVPPSTDATDATDAPASGPTPTPDATPTPEAERAWEGYLAVHNRAEQIGTSVWGGDAPGPPSRSRPRPRPPIARDASPRRPAGSTTPRRRSSRSSTPAARP